MEPPGAEAEVGRVSGARVRSDFVAFVAMARESNRDDMEEKVDRIEVRIVGGSGGESSVAKAAR